ncbi:MAG: hypothetical protein K2P99_00640 [Burkholderiales bacterium]|nr:hypothetical protein [Burkholderiales bacterium]
MFNGKVQYSGIITQVIPISSEDVQISVHVDGINYDDLKVGDIMLHNGCSLTVAKINSDSYQILIYGQTLACTVGLNQVGTILNIEKSLKIGDQLAGNFVTGFVDGVAVVANITIVGECKLVTFELAPELHKYLVRKSAIVVNGVSLTINDINNNCFIVNLGPNTLQSTNLNLLQTHSQVNIEIDPIAKYVYQFIDLAK